MLNAISCFLLYILGALSDVNSLYNDPHHYDGDMDDTSMSSRASSHVFDHDALLNFESLNAYCDGIEFEQNRNGAFCCPSAPDGFDTEPLSDVDFDSNLDNFPNMADMCNIRSVSERITKNFGQSRTASDINPSESV